MAFLELTNELKGWVPNLPLELAKKLVNRAWHDIRISRPWSFLCHEFDLVVPDSITAGTVAVTQYSPTVTGDATASAAWAGVANPVLTLRQFRMSYGAIYNIIAADFSNLAAVILTLDRNFQGATGTFGYQIYQAYYPAPSSNFLRWVDCVDPLRAYRFNTANLHRMKSEVDRIDPQRASAGMAYWIASYKFGTVGTDTNVPFFELWPHVLAKQNFLTLYQERGTDLVAPTDDIPPQICEEVLNLRARSLAYEWAEANKGTHGEMASTNWLALRQITQKDFDAQLREQHKLDDEAFLQLWVETLGPGTTLGPIDSAWMQSHASPWG